ncbi:MAG: BTAD domain-containing putative transcriptional regulator [Thiobacillaceae bacterium]
MESRPRLPGKLTVPSAAGLIARTRLFERLDSASERGVVWVCAPAGAGNTSLLSTWLRARRRFPLWYRMDADDNDPASFVHYLAQMTAALAPLARPLPPLTPEYLLGVETFARRFFRDFHAALPQPFALVLDDFHLIAADSPTMALIEAALAELPPESVTILSSRSQPPAALARWVVCGGVLEWDDLRMDTDEAGALLRQVDTAHTWDVAAITAATQGWAAGLVLVARAAGRASSLQPVSPEATEALYDYFARELFDGANAAVRELLLATALLPSFTEEQARALTGHANAGEILETLRREHFFIFRLDDTPPSYQYHPLFLAFLRHQEQCTLMEGALNRLRGLAAQLAEAAGQYEAAAQLYRDAQAWPQSTALICRVGPELMAQGRHTTLLHWLGDLPEVVVLTSPWLLYWLGMAQIYVNPELASHTLAQAYARFQNEGARDGAALACAGILESIYLRSDDFTKVQEWGDRLDELLPQDLRDLPLPLAARILTVVPVLEMARHDQPLVVRLVKFAEALLADPKAVVFHSFTAGAVLNRAFSGDLILAQKLLDSVMASSGRKDWPPVAHIHLLALSTFCAWLNARPREAYRHVEHALALAEESGVLVFNVAVLSQGVFAALALGDTVRASDWLDRIQPRLRPDCRINYEEYRLLRALFKLSTGDLVGAQLDLEIGVESCAQLGMQAGEGPFRVAHGWSLALSGQARRACVLMKADIERTHAAGSGLMEFWSRVAHSYALLAAGEEDAARKALALAFGLGRSRGLFVAGPFWLPREMGRLCAEALQAGIETDYVRRMIQLRDIPPPSPDVESWPWPVRVYTLGRFDLHKNGAPIRSSGKTQKKPLQLLKALIAMGGRGVAVRDLAEALWEDNAEGTARHALEMAVSRLRKLLGDDRALLGQEGKLALNYNLVWVDVWAFERLAGQFEAHPGDARTDLAKRAMDRYTGPFLDGDEEASWLLGRRDRLRSRFLRLVAAHGNALERLGQWNQAADVYRRALEREPLAENIYQRLMFCHLEQGENAQALETFRRCRDMLSIVLGIAPGPQTLALAARARGG